MSVRHTLLRARMLASFTWIISTVYSFYWCCNILPGSRGMACWLHSQLAGRAPMCIPWLLIDLRFWALPLFNVHLSINCSDCNLKVLSYTLQLILQGAYVYDINGKKYIDALAGLWCTALGMCTARSVEPDFTTYQKIVALFSWC